MNTNDAYKTRSTVFAAAFVVIFCVSSSAAFSVFAQPLQEATGGSAAQVVLTLTIYQFFMSLFGIISGKIVDKQGPKRLMYIGGLVYASGWILTGFTQNLGMLYLTYGVIAGAGNGLLYNPSLNTALRWYPEKKGTMAGVLLAAASLGPFVAAKGGAMLYANIGISGFFAIGAFYFILIALVGWKMCAPATDWQPEGFKIATAGKSVSKTKDHTPKEMVSTSRFWLLLLLFSLSNTAGIMMIGSLSSIAQVQLEMTPLQAANMVMINTFANFCGRLTIGRIIDKLGEKKTLAIILMMTSVGLLGLSASNSVLMFSFFLIILGAAFGGVLVVFPPLTNNTFGTKNSGVNYGIMFFGYSIGAFIGPQIAANFVNLDSGIHAYSNAYLVAVGVAVVALVLDIYLIVTEKKVKLSSEEAAA